MGAYDGFILKRICPQLQGLPFPLPCVAVFKPCVPSEAIISIITLALVKGLSKRFDEVNKQNALTFPLSCVVIF